MPAPSLSPEDEEAIEKIRSLMRKVDGDPRIRAAVREALKKIGAWQEPESQPEPPPTITYPASEERVVIPDPHAPGFLGTYTPPAEYRVELDEKPSGRATSDPESPAGRT